MTTHALAFLAGSLPAIMPGHWWPVRDGDARARALYHRHYSRYIYQDGRHSLLFVGPGEKYVLLTLDCRAVFVWRKFIDASGQLGVNCAVFRNEGPIRSSDLICQACDLAWARWPGERLYTYVNDRKVASGLAGACFLFAGWRYVRERGHRKRTGSGLLILERMP